MSTLYQLVARGSTACFGMQTLYSRKVFPTREAAVADTEAFKARCCTTPLQDMRSLTDLLPDNISISVVELELVEDAKNA